MNTHNVLLINPTITSRRNARHPLALLTLAASLDGRYRTRIIDGNVDRNFESTALQVIHDGGIHAVGVTVMGGPQLQPAISVSKAIRTQFPAVPIIWGGYYPTICPVPSIKAPYVDYVVRGPGEETLAELLRARLDDGHAPLDSITGLTWKRNSEIVHNPNRPFSAARRSEVLPYDKLPDPECYLGGTFLGRRTAGFQAAQGCRFRCTFCGVAAMYQGKTALPSAIRLEQDIRHLQRRFGADSLVFYDNNFFDREVDMVPLLEVLAKFALPWWCYARSDALLNLSEQSWSLVEKSRLRMAYIGAESPSDELLRDFRKGTNSDQTLAAVEKCRAHGVVPELSFMLAPPEDPEGGTERTFDYIRKIKAIHPATEIMLYIYTPLPPAMPGTGAYRSRPEKQYSDHHGRPVVYPTTVDEWAEPKWVDYWCHRDAPWLNERLRKRILDFTTVLGCRFPTITDIRSPRWAKSALRAAASWRYRLRRYDRPWELDLSRRFIRLYDPRVSGL
jgi:anaerobic magnesium-protoporphyrin IX monomethyl ester cyclase